ncbi:MAG: hypothetical protein HKN70_14480 [Gammaproteobacteria bacterium]|nr:hypothetical protein [Gammaproteobacteria bacterium]
MSGEWLIYGAYGYTGQLIALEARKRGMQPVIGGRTAGPLTQLAGKTGFRHVVLDLDEPKRLRRHLEDISLVLNCAGPFSATAPDLIDACIDTGTHYLDITGEIDVFEYAQSRHAAAKNHGIVICPGVGFDVVPTDCLAATLKNAMPDGTLLALGFDARASLSPGTAKTTLSRLPDGGKIRVDGEIRTVPLAYRTRTIDFGNGAKLAMTIPWGDVSTAFHTTGIPNITTWIPASEKLIGQLKRIDRLRRILGWGWVQRLVRRQIEKKVHGPTQRERDADTTYVWGELRNDASDLRTARLTTANGYTLTVLASIEICQYVLTHTVTPGAYTPAALMGSKFVCTLPGSSQIDVI